VDRLRSANNNAKEVTMSLSNGRIVSRSRTLCALVITAGVALAPATALASKTWFGSRLNHEPGNAGSTCSQDGVGNPGDVCTHVGSDYPGTSGRARSPMSGKITALRVDPEGPMTFRAEVVSVRHLSSELTKGQAQATAISRTITLAGPTPSQQADEDYPIDTVRVDLKVKKGQEIAINTTSNTAEICSDSTPGQLLFDPTLSVGDGFRNSAGVDDCLMLVQAVVSH
jgi:hypothetical protein